MADTTIETINPWAKPKPVSDLQMAFPANVCGTLLPPEADIPEAFLDWDNQWSRVASHIFFSGSKPGDVFDVASGIDRGLAFRHLKAVLGSFEPRHEHKSAGAGYLLSLWFTRVELRDGDKVLAAASHA